MREVQYHQAPQSLASLPPVQQSKIIQDHRSSPATADLDDDEFPRADYLCQLGNGRVLLVRRYTFLPRRDPYDALYNVMCTPGFYLYSCMRSRTASNLLQYHHRGLQYSLYRCASDQESPYIYRRLAAKHTRLKCRHVFRSLRFSARSQ